jgi:hypothetical protein
MTDRRHTADRHTTEQRSHTTTTTAKRERRLADTALARYRRARLACEEQASLYGTDSAEYEQACRAYEQAEQTYEQANRRVGLARAWESYHEDYDDEDGVLTDAILTDLCDIYERLLADRRPITSLADLEEAETEAVAIVASAQ